MCKLGDLWIGSGECRVGYVDGTDCSFFSGGQAEEKVNVGQW